MNNSNRRRKPTIKRKLANMNRIVRVRHNRLNTILSQIADDLGCPYQIVFEEFIEYAMDEMNFSSSHFKTVVTARLLEKYTGDE